MSFNRNLKMPIFHLIEISSVETINRRKVFCANQINICTYAKSKH